MRDMNGWLSRAAVSMNRARLPLLREQLRRDSMLQLACHKVSVIAQVTIQQWLKGNRFRRSISRNGGLGSVCHYDRKKGRPMLGTAFG